MSVVIIRLTVLTYYVWIAVTGESGRSYLKAWLEALGEDRARQLPTRSPTSADPRRGDPAHRRDLVVPATKKRNFVLHICLSAVDAQFVRHGKRDTSLKQICRNFV